MEIIIFSNGLIQLPDFRSSETP